MSHLIPVTVSDARITDGLQQGQVSFKFINLCFDAVSNSLWSRHVGERLGEFVHRPPHTTHFFLHFFCVYLGEWTWRRTRELRLTEALKIRSCSSRFVVTYRLTSARVCCGSWRQFSTVCRMVLCTPSSLAGQETERVPIPTVLLLCSVPARK